MSYNLITTTTRLSNQPRTNVNIHSRLKLARVQHSYALDSLVAVTVRRIIAVAIIISYQWCPLTDGT